VRANAWNFTGMPQLVDPPTTESLGTLTYFPLVAKGLAPALCAEFSGMKWQGNDDTGFSGAEWGDLKSSGKPPFGQLPILETPKGLVIGQATAICNYIGHVAGTAGKDAGEFAMSQMLLAEGEDLYVLMQKYQPTCMSRPSLRTTQNCGERLCRRT